MFLTELRLRHYTLNFLSQNNERGAMP